MRLLALKILSGLVTAGFLIAAAGVAGDAPLAPAELARGATDARKNLTAAVDNTNETARYAASFADIADNVRRQLESSRNLLQIQLGLERASRRSLGSTRVILDRIRGLVATVDRLESRTRSVTGVSARLGGMTAASADGAAALIGRLDALTSRFETVIRQSRELNRKARGYAAAKEVP